MTRSGTILLAVLLVSGCAGSSNEPQEAVAPAAEVTTVTIPVEGMACIACAAGVRSTLRSIDGVSSVEVSLERRNARVGYEAGKVTPEELAHAVNEMGFKAGIPAPETEK